MTTKFDPTKPVQTRHGLKARIICTDRVCVQPIVALITDSKGNEQISSFNTSGAFWPNETQAANDLINIPEPKKWRAWKVEEIPIGAAFKSVVGTIYFPLSISDGGIEVSDTTGKGACSVVWISTESLTHYKHSIDGGKTWLPCGVEE